MENPSVIDVAYFAETPEIRNAVLFSSKIRHSALMRCHAIPGYENLPTEEKNRIYDKMLEEIKKEEREAAANA